MKRVVVVSDFHCGHRFGLTHPDFDVRPARPFDRSPAWKRYKVRRRCWKHVAEKAKELQPIDVLIVNGDCIDGKGRKSGATELIATDRNEQIDMAVAAIEIFQAGKIYMTFGTPYHTGVQEDWEKGVFKEVKAEKIGGHDFIDVNDAIVDYKHYVGRSRIYHGRHTPVAREKVDAILWNERKEYPNSDIIIRSHVHYFTHCGGVGWVGMTTPALQGYGSKFGSRIAGGLVDFGFVHFDIKSKKEWGWTVHPLKLSTVQQQVIKV